METKVTEMTKPLRGSGCCGYGSEETNTEAGISREKAREQPRLVMKVSDRRVAIGTGKMEHIHSVPGITVLLLFSLTSTNFY